MHRRAHRRLVPWTIAIVIGLPFFSLTPSATAHVDGPTVTAQHAFIGDPLFGLDTPQGSLFGIAPDERTAMASTTKLMTLDVTLHAVEAGVVSLNDQVTVDSFAASLEPPNSVMADITNPFCDPAPLPPCVTLEPGEVVSLETLSRGMMYPSGNDASWAIAYHVAQAYGEDTNGDSVVDGNDFVERMNQHAIAIGLTDTHFTSANGWDDPSSANPAPEDLNHYTTARELSMTIDHGLDAHEHYGEVIGLQGTYTDTSQGPNGPKTYMWTWGNGYPGWEGAKGGGTQNCNGGPNGYCWSTSARRIGRRVVASFMQGTGSIADGTFDFGFATIFHPDARGSSTDVGIAEQDDVDCFSSSRCVSAVLPAAGDVKLVSWEPDVDASAISKLDEELLPKSALPPGSGDGEGPAGDVAVGRLASGPIVLASRKGSSVELSRWALGVGGALSLLQDGVKAGPATTMDVQPVYADVLLTAFTDPDGALVLRSWRVDGSGIEKLDTYRDETRVYTQVALAGPATVDLSGHRAVTAARTADALVQKVWGVDETTGQITVLGGVVQLGVVDALEITSFLVKTVFDGELFPPAYYATAYVRNGALAMRFYRISSSGTPVLEGLVVNSGIAAAEVGIARLGVGGVLSAARDSNGNVQLTAWEALRNEDNSISPDRISNHPAPGAGSIELVRVPSTHADGDYVTAVTDPLVGTLSLRAYRSGDRPF